MTEVPPYLEVRGVTKEFPGVRALDGVSFTIRPGTVHALCGENGAGKSTLMKVINGLYDQDEGQIFVDGKPVEINNPHHALDLGIAMISQELNYVPDMTVAEGFFLGALPGNPLKVDWKAVNRGAREILDGENISISPKARLGSLTVSEIQTLEIARAVNKKAKVIIMDEPTSAIAHKETEHLFKRIKELRAEGTSIVYISHKMDEVFELADDITVLRDGQVVESRRADDFTRAEVISLMVGREFDESAFPTRPPAENRPLFQVENLGREDEFADINIHVGVGEVVGIAGLVGAGRTELMEAIFGLTAIDHGRVLMHGKECKIKSPQDAIKAGMAMLTEDRRLKGIVPQMSIRENASLASLKRYLSNGIFRKKAEREDTDAMFAKMRVKSPSSETKISSLSGGNQQKVLLARWLLSEPEILLLDEPTRGIDVGAKFEIYNLISEIAAEGKGALIVSSELPELMGLCDRIYVMSAGRITGELQKSEFDPNVILEFAMGELEESK